MRVRAADRPALEESHGELGRALALEDSFGYFMPMNKPPFDDLLVRQAMNYAIDREVYTQALFAGDSVLLSFPLQPEWPAHYEPLEDQPESVKGYFQYDPAKAEALLDEAGLTRDSDGTRFEINLLIANTNQMQLEAAEISLGFWDDIGVKVNLEPVDGPVLQSRLFEKQFDFFANNVTGRPNALNDFRAGHQWNRSNLNDPAYLEKWEDVLVATDSGEQARLIKEATSAFLELAPSVQTPSGFGGDYWQPWLQNHNGERVLAFVDYSSRWGYVWFDDSKK
jgi:peptide/nickel transport system substrate-binding protein